MLLFTSITTGCALVTPHDLCSPLVETGSLSGPQHKSNSRGHTHKAASRMGIFLLFPTKHTVKLKYYSREMFSIVSPAHWISNETMTRRLKCWLWALAVVGHVHIHIRQTVGGGAMYKKKRATISTQFIEFQCKQPPITTKGQHFNITVSVSFQTHRAGAQTQSNSRECLTALILCDCADDVFIEIHQVCDKIITFLDSSVIQTDVMRLPCRRESGKQTG